MLYEQTIIVSSEMHTKHVDMLCGRKVEFSGYQTCRWRATSGGIRTRIPIKPAAADPHLRQRGYQVNSEHNRNSYCPCALYTCCRARC